MALVLARRRHQSIHLFGPRGSLAIVRLARLGPVAAIVIGDGPLKELPCTFELDGEEVRIEPGLMTCQGARRLLVTAPRSVRVIRAELALKEPRP